MKLSRWGHCKLSFPVVKVAILPLGANAADVSVEMRIHAEGGLDGIPRETLELVVLEGLRQLGLHVDIESPHEAE